MQPEVTLSQEAITLEVYCPPRPYHFSHRNSYVCDCLSIVVTARLVVPFLLLSYLLATGTLQ